PPTSFPNCGSGGLRWGASAGVRLIRSVSPLAIRAAVGKTSTHTSYTLFGRTGSAEAFVKGWYGRTISPWLLTVFPGSRARNESTCHPAESCSDFEPPPDTSSTRTVTSASLRLVDTNR